MGWVDKLAGLTMGLVAGAAITWAAIGGLAELTYNPDLIEMGVATGGLEDKADAARVKDTLEGALVGSALVFVVIQVTEILPANALGFVPSSFMVALETLEGEEKTMKETTLSLGRWLAPLALTMLLAPAAALAEGNAEAGKKTYVTLCFTCHGLSGTTRA